MNRLVTVVYYMLKYSGCIALVRFIVREKISILVYHEPAPELFEAHVQYLLRNHHIITLAEYVDAVRAKNVRKLPHHSVVITIDDGHRSNYQLMPIIKKYHITPTIYLASGVVCTNRKYWWTVPRSNKEVEKLKMIADCEKNQYLYEQYRFSLHNEYPAEDRQALNLEEVQEMNAYVDFQSHTSFHPILTRCTDEEITHELSDSKMMLEDMLHKEIVHLSYPNGDYNRRIMRIAHDAGYDSARANSCGWDDENTNLFMLNTVGVSEKPYDHRIEIDLLGIPKFFVHIRDKVMNSILKMHMKSI